MPVSKQPVTRKMISNLVQRFADEFGRLALKIEIDHMEFDEVYAAVQPLWRDMASLLEKLRNA